MVFYFTTVLCSDFRLQTEGKFLPCWCWRSLQRCWRSKNYRINFIYNSFHLTDHTQVLQSNQPFNKELGDGPCSQAGDKLRVGPWEVLNILHYYELQICNKSLVKHDIIFSIGISNANPWQEILVVTAVCISLRCSNNLYSLQDSARVKDDSVSNKKV